MTSISFIAGVLPLVLSTGAGAEMRQAIGIAVFSGMIGVTIFGLIFTPMFYVLLRKLAGGKSLQVIEDSVMLDATLETLNETAPETVLEKSDDQQ